MDSKRELRFPLAVAVSYQNGDRGKHGEAVVARPRRGGRDLPEEFTFKTFCDWIRHELEEELRRWWKIKANGVGVPGGSPRPVHWAVSDSYRAIPSKSK